MFTFVFHFPVTTPQSQVVLPLAMQMVSPMLTVIECSGVEVGLPGEWFITCIPVVRGCFSGISDHITDVSFSVLTLVPLDCARLLKKSITIRFVGPTGEENK